MKLFKIISIVVKIFLGLVIILTISSLMGFPSQFRPYVIETGSMEPVIERGSLAFVSPQESYQVGDIITFKTPLTNIEDKEFTVTHQIISFETNDFNEEFVQTKGVANEDPDPVLVPLDKIIGKVIYHVPYIGRVVNFAKSPVGFISLIVAPALFIIFSEAQVIRNEVEKMRSKKAKDKS